MGSNGPAISSACFRFHHENLRSRKRFPLPSLYSTFERGDREKEKFPLLTAGAGADPRLLLSLRRRGEAGVSFPVTWLVDRVVRGLSGGGSGRDSAPVWRNKFVPLPLPRRRRRVGGAVGPPACGSGVLCSGLISTSSCGGEGVVRRFGTPALLRPLESGQRGCPSGSSWSFCPPSPSGRGVELFCCRLVWRFMLVGDDGDAGLLLAFWDRIWARRRCCQVRSSTKISSLVDERLKRRFQIFDDAFLAGWKVVFLLLRFRSQRFSGGYCVAIVGVECVGAWLCACILFVLVLG